jgi:hypothetical protein
VKILARVNLQSSSYHFVIAVWSAKERIPTKAPMAIHKNAASKEKKRMSVETINSLAWWFGGLLFCSPFSPQLLVPLHGIYLRNHPKSSPTTCSPCSNP